jgi:hypothetical protein
MRGSTPWKIFGWDLAFYLRFSFSPKKGFNNVTKVIIKAFIGAGRGSAINFSFWLGYFDLNENLCFR